MESYTFLLSKPFTDYLLFDNFMNGQVGRKVSFPTKYVFRHVVNDDLVVSRFLTGREQNSEWVTQPEKHVFNLRKYGFWSSPTNSISLMYVARDSAFRCVCVCRSGGWLVGPRLNLFGWCKPSKFSLAGNN